MIEKIPLPGNIDVHPANVVANDDGPGLRVGDLRTAIADLPDEATVIVVWPGDWSSLDEEHDADVGTPITWFDLDEYDLDHTNHYLVDWTSTEEIGPGLPAALWLALSSPEGKGTTT